MVTESKPKPSLPRLSIASNRADERRSARVDLMTDDEHRKSSRSKPGALPNQIFPLLFAFAGKLKEARDVVFRPRGTRRRRTGETDRREKKEKKARSNGKQGRRGRKGNASVGKDDRLDQAGRRERRRLPKLDALSGAAAGCLVSIFLHPIDTVKVLVQTEFGASRNLLQVFRKLVTSSGGPQRLYYGLAANLGSSMPISAIYTSSYEASKHTLLKVIGEGEDRSWITHCLAGASASVATSFVYTPSECIKNRVQAGIYTNSWSALYQVVSKEGFGTLYRAWPAVLLRNVPQSIVKFFAYEQLKLAVSRYRGRDPDAKEMLAVGGLAGASAALFSTPFDVVKTRMQTQVGRRAQLSLNKTLRAILVKEGFGGLYRGVLPRIFIYLSQGAIFFTTYEILRTGMYKLEDLKESQSSMLIKSSDSCQGGMTSN